MNSKRPSKGGSSVNDWQQGITDALAVCDSWLEEYNGMYKTANDKHNKMAFYLCIKAIENVKEWIEKTPPPGVLGETGTTET